MKPYEPSETPLTTSPGRPISFQLVGRLHSEEAAKILGFQPFDIPVLVKHRLLKPLGNPVQNSVKYFAAVQILEAASDPEWLDKATRVISQHWKTKNRHKPRDRF